MYKRTYCALIDDPGESTLVLRVRVPAAPEATLLPEQQVIVDQ